MYLGSSVDVAQRLAHHATALRKGRHCNRWLQSAWNKYGPDSFLAEIVVLVPAEALPYTEQTLLDSLCDRDLQYNISKDVSAPFRGRRHTQEWKLRNGLRMRGNQINRGRKHPPDEIRKRSTSVATALTGKRLSKKHRAALRRGWEKRRQWWSPSEEARAKWRADAAARRDPVTGRIT